MELLKNISTAQLVEELRKREQIGNDSILSEKTTFYVCDPSKNRTCTKNTCQVRCKLTPDVEFAKLDEDGKPIVGIVV